VLSTASPFSVDETVERLQGAIRSSGLTLFAHIDHRANAERVGLAMRPARLLIFGNPRIGTPLMVASPLLAIDLPLKALIWQDQDGQTWVSYNSIPYLAGRHSLSPDLSQTLVRVEDLVAAALL
jgi:uncharacterized protein (DUF302 family)